MDKTIVESIFVVIFFMIPIFILLYFFVRGVIVQMVEDDLDQERTWNDPEYAHKKI